MVKNYPGLGQKPYYTELKEYIEASIGKSAYEVAVADGFVGTEAEWLASLKGTKGDKGDTGDTGPMGASGVNPGEIPVTQGDLLVGGATSALEPLALPSYGQELRRKGVQLAWGKAREAHLNDRNDIDTTGVADMGATITTYLAEYKSLNIPYVYCEPGSQYGVVTPIQLPSKFNLIGGQNGYSGTTIDRSLFIARAGCETLFRLTGWNQTISGVSVLQNGIAKHGIELLNAMQPTIAHSYLQGATGGALGANIWGGANENIHIHHCNIRGGSGAEYGVDLQLAHHPIGGYYGTDNRSLIELSEFNTGGGPSVRVSGQIRIRDLECHGNYADGVTAMFVLGEQAGPATHTFARFEDNYLELGSKTGPEVPVGVLVGFGAKIHITGNQIYGNTAFPSIPGSAAIKWSGYTNLCVVAGNAIERWDVGISQPTQHSGDQTGEIVVAGNRFSSVNTEATGGDYGTRRDNQSVAMAVYDSTLNGRYYAGRRVAHALYRMTSGTDLNLRLANSFQLAHGSATTVVPTNTVAGQTFELYFETGNVTLQTSAWRLKSGANETPPAGTTKRFMTDYNGNVREVTLEDPRKLLPAVQTAAFTAAADATVYPCDATAGAFNAQLPDGRNSVWNPRTQLTFRKVDASANAVTVIPRYSPTDKIEGAANYRLTRAGDWITVQANNTGTTAEVNWSIVASGRSHTPAAALTAADATAIDTTWDAAEQGVVENLRTRVNELESRLKSLGLLS